MTISSNTPIRDHQLINSQAENTISDQSANATAEVKAVAQVFNETLSANDNLDVEVKDAHGFSAFDQAVQARDIPLARQIMQASMKKEWGAIKEACKRAEAMDKDETLLTSLLPDFDEKELKALCFRGYVGHSNLLKKAIYTADFKFFIRLCMDSDDGSWRDLQDPETLMSVLHMAMATGQEEIIYYLLLKGANAELVDAEGLTAKQAAEKYDRQDIADLIDHFQTMLEFQKQPSDVLSEKIASFSPEMKEKLSGIINSVESYIEVYKTMQSSFLSEDGKLTDEGKAKRNFATHGFVQHQESSQGHNAFIIKSIADGSLENLVAHAKMGAPLDTLSVPWQKAVEDPHAYGLGAMNYVNESMRSFLQENKEVFFGEDPAIWDRNLGVGKSLLDMAVLYSNEAHDNLDIIAYLMSKGLDPLRTNDEGESPFSIALIKGNLKAASLMMNYEKLTENEVPKVDDAKLNKAFLILKEGAVMRDPLYVNSTKTKAGAFAALYFCAAFARNEFLVSMVNFFSVYQSVAADELSYREKLSLKPEQGLYLPEIIKKIYPTASKASILEIVLCPEYSVGTLGMCALNVYSSVMSTFSSLKTACNYITKRPLASAYKVGMDVLPTFQSVLRLNYYVTTLVYPALKLLTAEGQCEEINPRDYRWYSISQKLDSPKLKAHCKEHAKAIFTDKWDQEAFDKAPDAYLDELYAASPVRAMTEARAIKLTEAINTLKQPSFMRDTAIKGGIIGAVNLLNPGLWQPIARASIFYNIGTRVLRRLFIG